MSGLKGEIPNNAGGIFSGYSQNNRSIILFKLFAYQPINIKKQLIKQIFKLSMKKSNKSNILNK